MEAQRVLKGNNGKQQPFMHSPGMEVSTEGAFDCVQNKKAKNEIIVCLSINSARSSKLKNVTYLFLVRALNQTCALESFYNAKETINKMIRRLTEWKEKRFANYISDMGLISKIHK